MSVIPFGPSNPCPKCGQDDSWCWTSSDRRYLFCRRVEEPGARRRTDKNGEAYFLYICRGAGGAPEPGPGRAASRHPLADADARSRVYQALLESLSLSSEHRNALLGRGLPEGAIDRAGYRTLPPADGPRNRAVHELQRAIGPGVLLGIPGFYKRVGTKAIRLGGTPGILIPVRDERGRILACAIRADDPSNGGKYRWLSAPLEAIGCGPGALVHVPLFQSGPLEQIRITEGHLKADVATALSGTLTIGLPGVGTWRLALPVLAKLGARSVLVAFDADVRRNAHVALALERLAHALWGTKLTSRLELWDERLGKGIDDVYARGHADAICRHEGEDFRRELEAVVANAKANAEPASADVCQSASVRAVSISFEPDASSEEKTVSRPVASARVSTSEDTITSTPLTSKRDSTSVNLSHSTEPEVARETFSLSEDKDVSTTATSVSLPASDRKSTPTAATSAPASASEDHSASTEGAPERLSQSAQLLELTRDVEVFHSPDGRTYGALPVQNHREVWPLASRAFEEWLARAFYQSSGKAPGSQAIRDALNDLQAQAKYDGPERSVHVRVGADSGCLYLDLVNPDWQVVEISVSGWRLLRRSPVDFCRTPGMHPLPEPVSGGSVDELRPFLNLETDDDWHLVVAWLLAALRPSGPYPIALLQGEQGSSKSTTARVLRALIDPNTCPLRTKPREERDLMVAAANSRVVCFDNLSGLPQELSDALCRLSTGGGFSTRQLFTDSEEILLDVQRPVILTGIDSLTTRPDLTDRALSISLPHLPEERRRREDEFWREFYAVRPRVLGALLTALAGALRNIDHVRLERPPRMADFAAWAVAAEPALAWAPGTFLAAYGRNRQDAFAGNLEADPIGDTIREFAEKRRTWAGTATELLAELSANAPEALTRSRGWPHSTSFRAACTGRCPSFERTASAWISLVRIAAARFDSGQASRVRVTQGPAGRRRMMTETMSLATIRNNGAIR